MRKRWAMVMVLAGSVLLAAAGCRGPANGVRSSRGGLSQRPRRAVVGITSAYIPKGDYVKVYSAYTEAVQEAGGTPVILPVIDDEALVGQYARMVDGLLLTGGDDVPPEAYGEKPVKQTQTLSPRRHRFEKAMVEAYLATGKPILGICRGCQEVNVVCGGTLVQDIPTQVGTAVVHRAAKGAPRAEHTVTIEPDTMLRSLLAAGTARVNSNHHQAVRAVGKHLRVSARSADGVIEALEFTDGRFGLLVQWHPESIGDAKHRRAIYGAFVRACGAGRARARDASGRP